METPSALHIFKHKQAIDRISRLETSEQVYFAKKAEDCMPKPRSRLTIFFINALLGMRDFCRSLLNGERKGMTVSTLIMILAVAFILRGFFFASYSFSDDFGGYAWTVQQINNDIDNPLPNGRLRYDVKQLYEWSQSWSQNLGFIYGFRYGMLYPLVFLSRTVGASPNVFGSYHLFLNLLQILCVFLLLRKIFGDEAGLAGALMLAILPMDMVYATYILPDTVVPAYMTIALTFFFFAYDRKSYIGKAAMYLTSGAFLALAYYSRIYALFLAVSMAGILLYRRRFDLWALFAPAGALLVLFAINYPMYLQTGTFLADFRAFSQAERVFRDLFPVRDTYRYATYFFHQLLEGDLFIPFTFLAIAGAGTIAGVRKKDRFVPLLWFAGIFIVADIGSAKYYEYTMVHKLPRFMTMFAAPIAALGGILAGHLSSKRALFYTAMFLLGLVIMLSVSYDIPVWGLR